MASTPPFGSTKCPQCKGTGLSKYTDGACEQCEGEGWLTPDRQRALTTPTPPRTDHQHRPEPRAMSSRQQAVFDVLRDGQWHDGPELTHPAVGGSEGLRRLRELRDMGYEIQMRLKAKGQTTRQYRMVAR